jgi:hypothetical protein
MHPNKVERPLTEVRRIKNKKFEFPDDELSE